MTIKWQWQQRSLRTFRDRFHTKFHNPKASKENEARSRSTATSVIIIIDGMTFLLYFLPIRITIYLLLLLSSLSSSRSNRSVVVASYRARFVCSRSPPPSPSSTGFGGRHISYHIHILASQNLLRKATCKLRLQLCMYLLCITCSIN